MQQLYLYSFSPHSQTKHQLTLHNKGLASSGTLMISE